MFSKPKLMPVDESLDRPTWILLDDFFFLSDRYGKEIRVPAGFVTDLASVPRWPGVYEIAGGQAITAAVVHDYLYQTKAFTREICDEIFRELMTLTGVQTWRAKLMYDAVVALGGPHYGITLSSRQFAARMSATWLGEVKP